MAYRHGPDRPSSDSVSWSRGAVRRYDEDHWYDDNRRYDEGHRHDERQWDDRHPDIGERRWDDRRQWDDRRPDIGERRWDDQRQWDDGPQWDGERLGHDRRRGYGDSQRSDERQWYGDAQWYDETRDNWPDRTGDQSHQAAVTGGAEGNERLTALTGMALLVLFAAEGFTILSVQRMLTLHFFIGMLVIGPVALKACAVLYRFMRYYTGAPEYRKKGPPAPLLRVLGPVVLLSSIGVIGTGVMLAITGPTGMGTWLFLHRATFVLWFGAMTVHVLTYVWRLPRLVSADLVSHVGHRAHEVIGGRWARWGLLSASLLTGLMLAVVTFHRAGLWSFLGH